MTDNKPNIMPTQDYRALTIYEVMVSSFNHADDGAGGYSDLWGPDGNTKNGNLKGVTAALEHIASLGCNAIWLTPIFDSTDALGGEKLRASGYFARDYFKIDPKFGTEDDLRELVDKAHSLGLYVILDGVFGHHGGVDKPSPDGHTICSEQVLSERGEEGGEGNVKYPESLDYFKEVATYWIENFGIDGWRFDQAYQLCQDGHNYWVEVAGAVRKLCEQRRKRGEQWGVLGYMVGEDWSDASGISARILRDGGLKSAFDFDGKTLISGPMGELDNGGLLSGWQDIITVYSSPESRGYSPADVLPNLFLSNHDGYRVADHFYDNEEEINVMTRLAILAGYPGPITLYYGDEFADLSRDFEGSQPDNASRTSGHIMASDERAAHVYNYAAKVFNFRRDNPAIWRGEQQFNRYEHDGADVLVITKTDTETGERVIMVFSDRDTTEIIPGLPYPLEVKAYVPELLRLPSSPTPD